MRSEPSDLRDIGAAVERVLEAGGARFHNREWWFLCVAHPDTHATNCAYHPEKQVWKCHSCGAGGGVLDLARRLGIDVGGGGIDPAAMAAMRADRERIAVELAESKRRQGLAMAAWWAEAHLQAELQRHADALDWLAKRGIRPDTVNHFGLGWTVYGAGGRGVPALAIPWTVGGVTRAVQYRLLADNPDGGRYRWHDGSAPTLFNADIVVSPHSADVLIVEGAGKAMALDSHGITSVCAIPNKGGWKPEFAPPFRAFERVTVCLDPDAHAESRAIASTVPGARVAYLPQKPDDLLLAMRGDIDAFMGYIASARKAD